MTEITCHATAAQALFPQARTVIDIGGEDTKVVALDHAGRVKDFMMNNKCAAGTGRFLEAIAERLGCSLKEFIAAGEKSTNSLDLNSTCTVFAESEVVSLVASGASLEDISRGVHKAIAGRIIDFSERLRDGGAVVLTGGVAKNRLLIAIIREMLKGDVLVPDEPQITGALGAALLAERLIGDESKKAKGKS
jgi:predicted CoA-substrate-specific enzyme activase